MSDTLTDESTQVVVETAPAEPGDHDTFAHYVGKEALAKAIFDGVPCRALCGKMWLPTKDASRFPVCPECKERWDQMEDDIDPESRG